METYYAFKASNFTKVRRTWLGLLNVILAMVSFVGFTGLRPRPC